MIILCFFAVRNHINSFMSCCNEFRENCEMLLNSVNICGKVAFKDSPRRNTENETEKQLLSGKCTCFSLLSEILWKSVVRIFLRTIVPKNQPHPLRPKNCANVNPSPRIQLRQGTFLETIEHDLDVPDVLHYNPLNADIA